MDSTVGYADAESPPFPKGELIATHVSVPEAGARAFHGRAGHCGPARTAWRLLQ
jgi:hypothetical protein